MNREQAIELWTEANTDRCCSCHLNPPCGFCEAGFNLPLDEYISIYVDEVEEKIDNTVEDYERAMRGIS